MKGQKEWNNVKMTFLLPKIESKVCDTARHAATDFYLFSGYFNSLCVESHLFIFCEQ